MLGVGVFFADGRAVYDITEWNGEVLATGRRTGTVYRSANTTVRVTGACRRQRTGQGWTVDGKRAILSLDTGEGMSEIPGVWRAVE